MFRNAAGETMPYRLLVPRRYNPRRLYPLVLFLHGDGERGTDNESQTRNGGSLFLDPAVRRRYPSFVVFPQMGSGDRWVDVPMDNVTRMVFPSRVATPLRIAVELVGAVSRQYHVDTHRIYVMGVSDGGFGVWDALIRYPRLFAAGVSICGGADPAMAPALVRTPIWAMHSEGDTDVQISIERDMVMALRSLNSKGLRYTEFAGLDHVPAFTAGLKEPELLQWVYAQRLR